jgi:hypothetical protein
LLERTQSVFILALPPQDITGRLEDARIVRQAAARDLQLRECRGVITRAIVEMPASSEMRFRRIGTQLHRSPQRSFCRGQPSRGAIESTRIQAVVHEDELTEGGVKQRISRHGAVQQFHGLAEARVLRGR